MPQPPAPRPLDNRVLAACRDILLVAGAHADNGRLWLGGAGTGSGGAPPLAPAGLSEVVARAVARGRRDGAAEQNAIAEAIAVLAEHTLAQYVSHEGLGAGRGQRAAGTPPHPPRGGSGSGGAVAAAVGDFVADAEDADTDSDGGCEDSASESPEADKVRSARLRLDRKRQRTATLEAYLRRLREEGPGGGRGREEEEEVVEVEEEIPRMRVLSPPVLAPAPVAADLTLIVHVRIAGLTDTHTVTVRPTKTAHSLVAALSDALLSMFSVDVRPLHPMLVLASTLAACQPAQSLGAPPLSLRSGAELLFVARDFVSLRENQ